VTSSALFGILQLDKGEPAGYANIPGLLQAWLQDAGGFAMVGLVVYLLYALATPTDKSQSERIRVPVSLWMILAAGISFVCYCGYLALWMFGKGAPPPVPTPIPGMPVIIPHSTFRPELRPLALMIAGTFALLGIGEPFARDMIKIARRNLSLSFSGVRRLGSTFSNYTAGLFTPKRMIAIVLAFVAYGIVGAIISVAGSKNLFGIWAGWLYVLVGVFVCAMLILLIFEAEGPIWAIAKLSFKEAIRNQLLWVFLLIFLPFAFRNILMYRTKPVDEVRTLVDIITLWVSILLLFVAGLLSSLAIPNDIKNLNIYTIVSKPIERFEVVLGRFVGYVSLFSIVMIGATGVCLVMLANSTLNAKAKDETYKARVPVRGKIEFRSRKAEFEGQNVGREFDYRKYIAGHELSSQRAIWNFYDIPSSLATAEGDKVPVEFTFDIYKLTKGEQNKGASVNFRLVTYHCPQQPPAPTIQDGEWSWVDKTRYDEYKKAVEKLEERGIKTYNAKPGTEAWTEVNKLAEEFGYYEFRGKEVFDYTVMGIEVPAGIFRKALKDKPPSVPVKDRMGVVREQPAPRLSIYVKCETGGQLLGMAEADLYLLEYEQPFELNFLKGMIGLWCQLCIVIGLAVACSTYLSGILSFLAAGIIFLLGFFGEHLNDLAFSRNVGGGPFQAFSQILRAEQPTAPLNESSGVKALLSLDKFWAWVIRRVQNLIPDVDSFSWSAFVSEGFNVNTEYLVVNLLVTFGYLLPWGILAYYLMKSREVAA
jgi:ABC-type transport system involved in multi-copper enzyme maturation permease subunit